MPYFFRDSKIQFNERFMIFGNPAYEKKQVNNYSVNV